MRNIKLCLSNVSADVIDLWNRLCPHLLVCLSTRMSRNRSFIFETRLGEVYLSMSSNIALVTKTTDDNKSTVFLLLHCQLFGWV